ncbi:hypothetical protein GCM10027591_03590 [Zhihengliuella somnathii]
MTSLLKSRTKEERTISLPHGQVLERIIRMLIAATAGGLVYGVATRASATACPAPAGQLGSEAAANGALPPCVSVTMSPSGWVYLVMALTAIVLLSRALYNSPNEATAASLIRKAGIVVAVIPLAAWIISLVMFMLVDPSSFEAGEAPSVIVPFASIDVEHQAALSSE